MAYVCICVQTHNRFIQDGAMSQHINKEGAFGKGHAIDVC